MKPSSNTLIATILNFIKPGSPCGPAQHSKPVQPFHNFYSGRPLLYFHNKRTSDFPSGRAHINKYKYCDPTWPPGLFPLSDKPYVTSVINYFLYSPAQCTTKNFNIMHDIHKNKRRMESCEIIGHHKKKNSVDNLTLSCPSSRGRTPATSTVDQTTCLTYFGVVL